LRERGELIEVTIDPERKHFDPNPTPHHHIMCTECGKIGDVFTDYSEALRLPENITSEFMLTGNHVDFFGLCAGCRDKNIN